MRATLLHSKRAGSLPGSHPKRELIGLLRDAGYKVDYWSTRKPGWEGGLADPGDLVVAAGGDGTVGKVLRRMPQRDVPVALLPLGTANNIATSLGISGTPQAIIAGIPGARRVRLDLGMARSAAGDRCFIESAGLGLFAEFLKQAELDGEDPESRGARLTRGLDLLARLSSRVASRRCRIIADGVDLTARYLVAMVLNIRCVGPRLALAPQAEPGDGKLDLLLVGPSRRAALREYIRGLAQGGTPEFPFPLQRVSRVRMGWVVGTGHLDDRLWPRGQARRQGTMTLEVAGPPFEVLVP